MSAMAWAWATLQGAELGAQARPSTGWEGRAGSPGLGCTRGFLLACPSLSAFRMREEQAGPRLQGAVLWARPWASAADRPEGRLLAEGGGREATEASHGRPGSRALFPRLPQLSSAPGSSCGPVCGSSVRAFWPPWLGTKSASVCGQQEDSHWPRGPAPS